MSSPSSHKNNGSLCWVYQSFARLRGGQGWVPICVDGEIYSEIVQHPPEVRIGSFWFVVQSSRGIKVRRGPSRRAGSIKNNEGEYFRFECGEFLRASEVCTLFNIPDNVGGIGEDNDRGRGGHSEQSASQCFAKLYRNSHIQMHQQSQAKDPRYRSLSSISASGEWVQVYVSDRIYLEECANPPRVERHREVGWRYNAVCEGGVHVRRGPSFSADTIGKVLQAGESVLINERVTGHGERTTWLRLKDGGGWVHDMEKNGEQVAMIAHSLRHRTKILNTSNRLGVMTGRGGRSRNADINYNAVVARLFHGEEGGGSGMLQSKNLMANQ